MARRRRIQFPGAVYHVMSRGNRKSLIVDDDDDRRTFMDTFSEAATDHGVRVYACCLMGTHYHTLLDTPRSNLSEFIRSLNTEYSKKFNRRHARAGHTFEQRFASHVVQREKYLRRVARYIALNPVKARLCLDAAEWSWSTHRATAGQEEAPGVVCNPSPPAKTGGEGVAKRRMRGSVFECPRIRPSATFSPTISWG